MRALTTTRRIAGKILDGGHDILDLNAMINHFFRHKTTLRGTIIITINVKTLFLEKNTKVHLLFYYYILVLCKNSKFLNPFLFFQNSEESSYEKNKYL